MIKRVRAAFACMIGLLCAIEMNALANDSSLLPSPEVDAIEKAFQLPPGFAIKLIAAEPNIANPMSMCVDEHGALWVTEAHTYRWGTNGSPFHPPKNPIRRIKLGPDGVCARSIVALEGFAEPVIGIAARAGQIFATCLNELFVCDTAPDGALINRKVIMRDAATPWNPFGMYRVQVGPDNKLWVSIADHPSSLPVTLTGSDGRRVRLAGQSGGLVRCNFDGSGLEVIVHGFRAPYAFDIDPWGHIWQISNGEGSPNLYVHVIPGVDYGYASRKPSYSWLAGAEAGSPPVRDMGAGANTAAVHYFSHMFPEDYWGSIFVANWGSHGEKSSNREIIRFKRAKNGENHVGTSDSELFDAGKFLTSNDPMFRPTAVVLAPDGSLYVADWHGRDDENDRTGRIFKISYTAPHGDASERVEDAFAAAQLIWSNSAERSHVAADALARQLRHDDARVRAHAMRQLRQMAGQPLSRIEVGLIASGNLKSTPALSRSDLSQLGKPLLRDPSAEVRVEAALAQHSDPEVAQGLVNALELTCDARLTYQIGFHLAHCADVSTIASLWKSTNETARKAALIAVDIARYERNKLLQQIDTSQPQLLKDNSASADAKVAPLKDLNRKEELALTLQVQGGSDQSLKSVAAGANDLAGAILQRVAQGSALRGELTFHSTRLACAKCHSTDRNQTSVGPNLSNVGAASQLEYLIESILEPSKIIKTGFETELIETTDDRNISGCVEMVGDTLIVRSSAQDTVRIPTKEIRSRKALHVSLMPAGLEASCSVAELADLVAFLASLKN